jgi:hypothetical protein
MNQAEFDRSYKPFYYSNKEHLFFKFLQFLKVQGCRIDAIPATVWLRAIIEEVAEMSPAFFAKNFRAAHPEARVRPRLDRVARCRVDETRPSLASIEFLVRFEKESPTTRARIHAFLVIIKIFSREGSLGFFLSQHGVLFIGQPFFPFLVGKVHFIVHRAINSIRFHIRKFTTSTLRLCDMRPLLTDGLFKS